MTTVGIVNDLALARRILRSVVEQTPGFRVVWEAVDGRLAIERHRAQAADIILLDLIMPGLDGVQVTPLLMAVRPCAVLIVTATVPGHRQMVFAAMGQGALDAVETPTLQSPNTVEQFRRKLITISRLTRSASHATAAAPAVPLPRLDLAKTKTVSMPIVAIGASTGGPQAVAAILRDLPRDLPCAVLIAQHLDRHFVAGFQSWLTAETDLTVSVAQPNAVLEPGCVLLAYTDDHMTVVRGCAGQPHIEYTRNPIDIPHRPSIDVLFRSLAKLHGIPRMGVLLTGMGRDGAEGLLALHHSGAYTVAQDQGTSVVYGMPRAARELAAADAYLPVDSVGSAIVQWTESVRSVM